MEDTDAPAQGHLALLVLHRHHRRRLVPGLVHLPEKGTGAGILGAVPPRAPVHARRRRLLLLASADPDPDLYVALDPVHTRRSRTGVSLAAHGRVADRRS